MARGNFKWRRGNQRRLSQRKEFWELDSLVRYWEPETLLPQVNLQLPSTQQRVEPSVDYENPAYIGATPAVMVTAGTSMTISNIENVSGAQVGDYIFLNATARGTSLSASQNPAGWTNLYGGPSGDAATSIRGGWYKQLVAGANNVTYSWTGSGDGIMQVCVFRGYIDPGTYSNSRQLSGGGSPQDYTGVSYPYFKPDATQPNTMRMIPYTLAYTNADSNGLSVTNRATWVNVMSAYNSTTAWDIGVGVAYDTTLYVGQPAQYDTVGVFSETDYLGYAENCSVLIEPRKVFRYVTQATANQVMLATTQGPGVLNRPAIIATNTQVGTSVSSYTTPSLGSLWHPGDILVIQTQSDATVNPTSLAGFTSLVRTTWNGPTVCNYTAYRVLQSGDTTWTLTLNETVDSYSYAHIIVSSASGLTSQNSSTYVDTSLINMSAITTVNAGLVIGLLNLTATDTGTNPSTGNSVPSGMTELYTDYSLVGGIRNSAVNAAWINVEGSTFDPGLWSWSVGADASMCWINFLPIYAIDSSPTNYIANSYFVDLTGWSAG